MNPLRLGDFACDFRLFSADSYICLIWKPEAELSALGNGTAYHALVLRQVEG
jgi:hypothetical protein